MGISEIEVASDQSDHLADSKTRKITAEKLENGRSYLLSKKDHGGTGANQYTVEQTSQVDQSAESIPQVEDLKNSDQKYICLPHRELL